MHTAPVILHTDSPEATEAVGRCLGAALGPGAVLSLGGQLGAGKTCFVRGLAEGLGVDPTEVASPTYTLLHEHEGRLPLYHFDAWMSAREGAFLASGGVELLDSGGVAALEWADEVGDLLPSPRLELHLGHAGRGPEETDRRRIELRLSGNPQERPAAGLVEALEAARAWAAGTPENPAPVEPGPAPGVDPVP